MNGLALAALILGVGAPVPVPSSPVPPANSRVDRFQAENFARQVHTLANQVAEMYVRPVDPKNPEKALVEAAIRGLYDEAGLSVPDAVIAATARANSSTELVTLLADVRILLGNHPNLNGARSLFAAMNGFRFATDSISNLASPRVNSFASIDQDFGIGIELDGVVGSRWTLYHVEQGVATGRFPPTGYFGPAPKPDAVTSPAVFPWRVKRVIPGSPAQQAGVKPGDLITHMNGVEITLERANKMFSEFVNARQAFDPQTRLPARIERTITFQREGQKPFTSTIKSGNYTPESAFGVMRTLEDKWDCLLDRQAKIGYIRLGPIETGLDNKVAEMMNELTKQGCRGLILDLRWCPGGYVDPGTKIAGMFLKDGSVIAKMEYRNLQRAGTAGDLRTPPGGGKYSDLPLVVLVGQETTGGGELIASAIRDNDRCVIIGQRTVGRASIQSTITAGFADMQFRVTSGTSLRPNGKSRQKKSDSQPTDDWGIRPDDGLEVPITADKSAELRRQAELHALRPADSNEALTFDDVTQDPYRLAALDYLRKKLAKK